MFQIIFFLREREEQPGIFFFSHKKQNSNIHPARVSGEGVITAIAFSTTQARGKKIAWRQRVIVEWGFKNVGCEKHSL